MNYHIINNQAKFASSTDARTQSKLHPYQNTMEAVRHYFSMKGMDSAPEKVQEAVNTLKQDIEAVDGPVRDLYNATMQKYADRNLTYNQLYERAIRDAKKYGVVENQVKYFQLHYDWAQKNSSPLQVIKQSNKTIGEIIPKHISKVSISDKPEHLEAQKQILAIAEAAEPISNYITTMAFFYKNNSVITNYDKDKSLEVNKIINQTQQMTKPLNFIHPVIFALHAPRIDAIDGRFVKASMSNVLKNIINKTPNNIFGTVNALSNVSLYTDMSSAQVDSDVWAKLQQKTDLLEDYRLMATKLRMGVFYDDMNRVFIHKLNNLRNSITDSPDFVNDQDPVVFAQRLFESAHFKPTEMQVFTTAGAPINMLVQQAYKNQGGTVPSQAALYSNLIRGHEVHKTSMLHLNIPDNFTARAVSGLITKNTTTDPLVPIPLTQALQEPQLIVDETGVMKQAMVSVMNTDQVLIFAVDRQGKDVPMFKTTPVAVQTVISPKMVGEQYFKLNVLNKVDDTALEDKLLYKLRSVVTANLDENNTKLSLNQIGGQSYVFELDSSNKVSKITEYAPLKVFNKTINKGITAGGEILTDLADRDVPEFIKKYGVLFVYSQDNSAAYDIAEQELLVKKQVGASMGSTSTPSAGTSASTPSAGTSAGPMSIAAIRNAYTQLLQNVATRVSAIDHALFTDATKLEALFGRLCAGLTINTDYRALMTPAVAELVAITGVDANRAKELLVSYIKLWSEGSTITIDQFLSSQGVAINAGQNSINLNNTFIEPIRVAFGQDQTKLAIEIGDIDNADMRVHDALSVKIGGTIGGVENGIITSLTEEEYDNTIVYYILNMLAQ